MARMSGRGFIREQKHGWLRRRPSSCSPLRAGAVKRVLVCTGELTTVPALNEEAASLAR